MPQCIETVASTGRRCTRDVATEGHRCNRHHEIHTTRIQQAGPEIDGRCNVFLRRRMAGEQRWARCGRRLLDDHTTCELHNTVAERREEQRQEIDQRRERVRQDRLRQIVHWTNVYRESHAAGRQTLHQILEDITDATERGAIPWTLRHHIIENLADLIPEVDLATARENLRILGMQILVRRHHERVEHAPVAALRPAPHPITLQEIAADRQNVHRRDVSVQTNKGTELLLKQVVPADPRTCQVILAHWILGYGDDRARVRSILRVYDDMDHWYTKATCRKQNDFLYRKLLDGLWVLINGHATSGEDSRKALAVELIRRLYEECTEATGLCCEGHLTRLVNVMVGFDEAFQPPVSWKDVIGGKLSVISKQDIPLSEKISEATRMMDDLAVPAEERTVWIEALE